MADPFFDPNCGGTKAIRRESIRHDQRGSPKARISMTLKRRFPFRGDAKKRWGAEWGECNGSEGATFFGLRSAVRDYNIAVMRAPLQRLSWVSSEEFPPGTGRTELSTSTDSERNPMAGCRVDDRHFGSGGITEGRPKRRSTKPGLYTMLLRLPPNTRFWRIPTKMTGLRLCCQVSGISAMGVSLMKLL